MANCSGSAHRLNKVQVLLVNPTMAPSYTHIQNSTYGQWAIKSVQREGWREERKDLLERRT
ncbi:MAG: hypothetical protein ACK55Z_31705 [bacterium]